MAADRPAKALDVTESMVDRAPNHAVMAAHAAALKALGRLPEALALQRSAVKAFPESGIAEHNVATTLVEIGRFSEAEDYVKRAFSKKTAAPETWVVYGQSLEGQQRLQDAEVAFREALQHRPGYIDAHRRLSQLVWMRTGDAEQALAALNASMADQPGNAALLELKTTVLKYSGRVEEARLLLENAVKTDPASVTLRVASSHFALLTGHMEDAVQHARAASSAEPENTAALMRLCEACLAVGENEEAERGAERLLAISPYDQRATTYLATAWRQMNDKRYLGLSDYDNLVQSYIIDVPKGWSTLGAYLANLATALQDLHVFTSHPFDQTLRHGTQASHLDSSLNPVVRAFFDCVDGPIRSYIAALGTGDDLVRSRNLGGYAFQGVWSVRLRSGGFHTNHVHPKGWLSSACYIDLPNSLSESESREGWLRFGMPGIPTSPPMPAEHFVDPKPGRLVLFPSYMWHGTVPFSGEKSRLTVAFDLVPAPP